ncbi:hypothetical protein BJP34_23280 [Moorena producens PAL-8-15-08-1]|uniref:Uncharacterized protein n=1 Tax=Moorena producens PAL-8-15-08-1 TaxID=1458985 RepID=A0A1D8TWP3_9CYAN|nr:hypothetical protein BJP34_23280 [Moorena producens PAL-8-15-08-1]
MSSTLREQPTGSSQQGSVNSGTPSAQNPQGFKWGRVQFRGFLASIAPAIWDYVREMVVKWLSWHRVEIA